MTHLRVAVLGVGLIGGSIGLAARRRCAGGGAGIHVTGYDPDARVLAAALDSGAIDEASGTVADAVREADAVFVAAPVGALAEVTRQALCAASPECVVSDVGSTKRAIVASISDPRFVGGHPLAGAETAGVRHAREDLFDGAAWYLTPGPGASPDLLDRLRGLIEGLGARPVTIDALAHDRLMARVSHLPHVLANVLVAVAADTLRSDEGSSRAGVLAAGPSFRDATRVAGANTAIWTDIYMSNSDALVEAIDAAAQRLMEVRAALSGADGAALAAWNERARTERERLLKRETSPIGPAPKA